MIKVNQNMYMNCTELHSLIGPLGSQIRRRHFGKGGGGAIGKRGWREIGKDMKI